MANIIKINGQDASDTINVPFYFNLRNYFTCKTDLSTLNILMSAGENAENDCLDVRVFPGKLAITSTMLSSLDAALSRNSQKVGSIVDVEEVCGYVVTNPDTPYVGSTAYPPVE
jgi:hypothetical protein